MTGSPTITVESSLPSLKVKINGLLHLYADRSKLLAIHSWRQEAVGTFFIEYLFVGGSTICEHDSEENWKAILVAINRALP